MPDPDPPRATRATPAPRTSWCSRPSSAPRATSPARSAGRCRRGRSSSTSRCRALRRRRATSARDCDAMRAAGLARRARAVTACPRGRSRARAPPRCARLRRAGRVPPLPESPQHRAWRNARTAARTGDRALPRDELRERLERARALLDADPRRAPTRGSSSPRSSGARAGGWASRATACASGPSPTTPARTSTSASSRATERRSTPARAGWRARRAGRRNIALWDERGGQA